MGTKDPKHLKSVYELMMAIDRGDYAIPHFQRGFEWTPSMVSDLLKSILQDFFAGLLLLWELNPDLVRQGKWDPLWGAENPTHPSFAVLDGQQRLASLYYALCGPPRTFPKRKSHNMFFLNLREFLDGNYEDAITHTYPRNYQTLDEIKEQKNRWIRKGLMPLRLLSDRKFIDGKEFNKWKRAYARTLAENPEDVDEYDTLRDDIHDVVGKILNYEFPTHTLGRERPLSDVCTIFARINQRGMRLSTFDLMNAFLYPTGVSLKKLWEDVQDDRLLNVDKNMKEYMLKLISLYAQGYCSPKYIYNLIPGKKVRIKTKTGEFSKRIIVGSSEGFEELWRNSCRHAARAVDRIMNTGDLDFGAIKHSFIPNTTIVPVMGALFYKYEENYKKEIDKKEFLAMLNRWYWSAVISGEYSGSSETEMSEDYRDISGWFEARRTDDIRRIKKMGEGELRDLDLRNCRKGSSLYKAVLCHISLNKAEDFYTRRALDTGTYSGEKINDHHIFPKGAKGLPEDLCKEYGDTNDNILNRTLLLDDTNKEIRNKRPSEYVKDIKDAGIVEMMAGHLITESGIDCLRRDDYDGFIRYREKAVLSRLSDAVGVDVPEEE